MQSDLTFRQRTTWLAHLFKAVSKSYHTEAARFLRALVPGDGVIFDVGAHAGQFAKLFARLVPNGRVYAFEPSPYALSILKPMLRIKGLRNVTVIEAGLSDSESDMELHTPIKKRGSLGFGAAHLGADTSGRAVKTYMIHLTTIDTVVAKHKVARLDFLKADIEGWELHMLKGGERSIDRFRPAVLIEVNEGALARANVKAQDVFDFFQSKNYVSYFTDEHAGYRLELTPGFTRGGDYLFIPVEKQAAVPAA